MTSESIRRRPLIRPSVEFTNRAIGSHVKQSPDWYQIGSFPGNHQSKRPPHHEYHKMPKRQELDELEQYLADPEEPELDVKVLAWWQAKESKWPNLAKMVKQYFAAPASSAGVERVFSAAGKMHGDLSKSAKDTTLEHSLFAAFNTD